MMLVKSLLLRRRQPRIPAFDCCELVGHQSSIDGRKGNLWAALGREIRSKMKIKIRNKIWSKIQIKRKTIHDAFQRTLV